jgi:aspartate racemase
MRAIGLIGGMSAESTRLYYDAMNAEVRSRLGGLHSAKVIVYSVDFAPIAAMQADGRWTDAGVALADAACALERAGAQCIGLATNTMHKVADTIASAVRIPFLHIAEATALALIRSGKRRPYLLATRFTMEQDFYTGLLATRGLDVCVPDAADRAEVHRVIYEELCRGVIAPESRTRYEALTRKAEAAGCDSVILGCTEVGMLLCADNSALPVFDTTLIHARALVDYSLADETCVSDTP